MKTFTSLGLGLIVSLALAFVIGENPGNVLFSLFHGAFGSLSNLGYSLYYATPLIFTGLSVSYALRNGLFNIGAEGQMCLGGVAMTAVGIYGTCLPAAVAAPCALLAAFVAGGVW